MKKLDTIVIGTSLAAESDDIVRVGVALAQRKGACVHLVHSFAPPTAFAGLPAEALAGFDWSASVEQSLREQLRDQARRTGLAELAAFRPEHLVLAIRPAHLALTEVAAETAADLLVVGASERPWPALSSTADRVLRKARCPVLVVRPAAPFPPRRVLLPVDFSEVSAGALRCGADLLAGLGDARSEVLFVLNPLTAGGSLQFTQAQMSRLAADELVRFTKAHAAAAAPPSLKVRIGYPAQEIVRELADREADLVVLGTHGHGRLERLLIGSVTADVLREAPCSVLAVPPGAALAEAEPAAREALPPGADWTYVSDEGAGPA